MQDTVAMDPAHEVGSPDTPLLIEISDLFATDWRDECRLAALRTATGKFVRALPGSARDEGIENFAAHAVADVANWPVHEDNVARIEKAAERGQEVVLTTDAPDVIADAIQARFRFISRLRRRNGERSDGRSQPHNGKPVSERVAAMAAEVKKRVQSPRDLIPSHADFTTFRRALRLHQWAKNALIFVPLILGGRFADPGSWSAAIIGFIALGLVASATYLLNDLMDLPSDRQHWTKKNRPLASGLVSIRTGAGGALALLCAGLLLGASQVTAAIFLLLAYVVTTLSYSAYFKRVPVLDVFLLATLFTLRLGLGIALTDVKLSPWLLVFSMFVFLSLSVAKRHTEILRMVEMKKTSTPGRGYRADDAPLTLALGLASAMGAVLIMVVYLIEDAVPRQLYQAPLFLWLIPPILFLFLGRIWLLSQRGELNDDPVAFALKDKTSLALGVGMVASLVLAITGIGLT